MALFKILRGPSSELSKMPINDGYCYFTPDTGLFHIDYDGTRVPLNAKDAETLMGASLKHALSDVENKEDLKLEIPSSFLLEQIVTDINETFASKQDRVTGTEGQMVGFGANGELVAVDAVSGSQGLVDQNTGSLIKVWYGTTAEYEAIETKDENTIYILSDEIGGAITADSIDYYNGITGLAATNVQAALDEIATTAGKAGYVLETNKGLQQKFWRGTKEEYDALTEKDEATMYIVVDDDENENIIVDAYTKAEVDALLANMYTKTEVDAAIAAAIEAAFANIARAENTSF